MEHPSKGRTGNKVRTYILYAFGEILLVVIGILIALQVNNWNEELLKDKQIQAYLIQIQNEIIGDMEESKNVVQFLEGAEELIEKVLKDQVTESDYETTPSLRFLVSSSASFNINTDGFNNLINSIDESTFENQELLSRLKGVYVDAYSQLNFIDKWFRDYVHEYNNYLTENHDWYSTYDPLTDNEIMDEELHYKLTSPEYKNRVARYRNLGIGNFGSITYNLQIQMADLYKSLAQQTSYEPDHPVIAGYFKSPADTVYESFLGTYRRADRASEIILFEENDSLKIELENGTVFHVVEGSGNRFQLSGTRNQLLIENDSTLLQINSNRTRWRLVD